MTRAFIAGCEGLTVSADERAFLRDADPWGICLFARNVDTPDQVRRLTGSLRDALGRDAYVFVDQEGGRVQRMRPPHWGAYPAAATFGALARRDQAHAEAAVQAGYGLLAAELRRAGVDGVYAPCIDVPISNADPIIGDRAFADTPDLVTALGRAAMQGVIQGGGVPVVKHMPGHGRATVDSHKALPRVETDLETLTATDFAPFIALRHAPMAMTAHVVFTAVDAEAPVTTSARAMQAIVRGALGYDGLVMTDDLSMDALAGDLRARAAASRDAGCDMLLHGNGALQAERFFAGEGLRAELKIVAEEAPQLTGDALRRAEAALAARPAGPDLDDEAARALLAPITDAYVSDAMA